MTNSGIAKSFVEDAKLSLREGEQAFKDGFYHRTVRRCQECVELSLKGLLRYFGIEYPKVHDVGSVVASVLKEKTDTEETQITKLMEISSRLAKDREPSFYGSETGEPAVSIFSEASAEQSMEEARYVLEFVNGMIGEQ
ncbi:MAG: HEPN domain-containing protein [bacterium]